MIMMEMQYCIELVVVVAFCPGTIKQTTPKSMQSQKQLVHYFRVNTQTKNPTQSMLPRLQVFLSK